MNTYDPKYEREVYKDENGNELKDLSELKSFEGKREEAAIHRDEPIKKDHKCHFVKLDPSTIQCKFCSRGFTGSRIDELLSLVNA